MFIKRAFDLAAGTIILLLSLPLMAAIALAVKCDSPGPVIFAHRRIGRGGREFRCYNAGRWWSTPRPSYRNT
jgi:lipopolysaccharide/colanic/teichoic acid biosynthesis glycosyltransferase